MDEIFVVLGDLADAEENARLAVHAGALVARDPSLAMRIRGCGFVHEERRLEIVKLIADLGGMPPCPDRSRALLEHDARYIAANAKDDASLVRALLAMRADLVHAHIDAQLRLGTEVYLIDLHSLPSLTHDRTQ